MQDIVACTDQPCSALVTGCAGFIGSQLVDSLLADGQSVIGIDCFNDNYSRSLKLRNLRHLVDWDAFEFVPIDLSRGDLLDIAAQCDVVYHLAAEPGVRSSWGERYEQYVRNNVLATQHVLEAVKELPGVRFVYASSSSVYGDSEDMPTHEGSALRPLSPYGQTKASMEFLCELYRMSYGVDAVGLRYFTVYGPRQRPDMAFHRFCRSALRGESITVFGDGRQTRDFTYVADVVAATRAAAEASLGDDRVFNVGGGSPASIREVIDMIGSLSGRTVDVTYSAPERGDVRDTAADTARAREQLGFAPSVALREGLTEEFSWVQKLVTEPSAAF
jgi:nucleoside-diphosphate-sugar epimerase